MLLFLAELVDAEGSNEGEVKGSEGEGWAFVT